MKISVDFELTYDIGDADKAIQFCLKLNQFARDLEANEPAVEVTRETTRVVEDHV